MFFMAEPEFKLRKGRGSKIVEAFLLMCVKQYIITNWSK